MNLYTLINNADLKKVCTMSTGENVNYLPGDQFSLPDEIIYQNNSKRCRICLVTDVYVKDKKGLLFVYLLPKEAIPYRACLTNQGSSKTSRIDWSGLDGWLSI